MIDEQAEDPEKRKKEEAEAEERSAPNPSVVWDAVHQEGCDELRRNPVALMWSGLAAGLSMGFSLIGEGLLRYHLPDAGWRPLVAKLGYSVGFLVVVLGRFAHVIAGSVDKLFLVTTGHMGVGQFLGGFLAPSLFGNIIGGVSLVAALNHVAAAPAARRT